MLRFNRHCHQHHRDHANRGLNFDRPSSSSSVRPPPAPPEIQALPPPPTTQLPAKPNPKLISFILQAFIMTIVFSLFFVFVGIAVIVFLHLCLVGGALHRRHLRYRNRPNDDQSGLSASDIKTLPKFKFRPRSNEVCAICLENCVEGDWCRELPDCKHVFHANCVDMWLAKAAGCPVCRTTVRLNTSNKEESTRHPN